MKYIKCLEIGFLDSKILLKRLKIFFFKRIKKINILKFHNYVNNAPK